MRPARSLLPRTVRAFGLGPLRVVALGVVAVVAAAGTASAQHPVCAPLAAGEAAVVSCRPFSLFPSARFVADFGVDHLFKPAPPPFRREVVEVVDVIAAGELKQQPELADFLRTLSPLRFTQLDRTTGTVIANWTEARREFSATLASVEGAPTLTLRLPEVLHGGYWRGPDVVQAAFWKDRRVGVKLAWNDGRSTNAAVECISLSPDGLLVRFDDKAVPPLLVLYRDCQ